MAVALIHNAFSGSLWGGNLMPMNCDKRIQNWIVDRSTAHNFYMVNPLHITAQQLVLITKVVSIGACWVVVIPIENINSLSKRATPRWFSLFSFGVVHKLRWQDFGFFGPPTLLHWHVLWYERWQKMDIFGPPTYLILLM